jgi:hypothetical protein
MVHTDVAGDSQRGCMLESWSLLQAASHDVRERTRQHAVDKPIHITIARSR